MNNISVNVSPMGGLSPIHMEFLNGGKIVVPARYGGYVIASGCGAGKTTIIKQLLANPFARAEGILYSAFTIDECNLMYAHVKSVYEKEGRLDRLKDEVIVLHSDNKSEGTDNNTWRNNPEKLLTMPIVICTHHKLFNELPELLIRYKGYPRSYQDMSPVERAMAEIWTDSDTGERMCYLPRQYVLIDELPSSDNLNVQVKKSTLRSLGYKRGYPDPSGAKYPDGAPVMIQYTPTIYDRPRKFSLMKSSYDYDLTKDQKFMEVKDKLSETKLELLLGSMYDNYEQLINYDEDVINISYNASSLLVCNPATRILLFEGTGDLTFVNSKRFNVLTYHNKYSSKINLCRFDYNLKRYHKPDSDFSEIEVELDKNVDFIEGVIKSGKTPLIVTWKNLKSDDFKDKKRGDRVLTSKFINDEFSLPSYYKDALSRRGIVSGYDIIHYQSGLDKATNDYRDYDSIIFLGEFHVPNYVVRKFNLDWGTDTSVDNYTTYQLVQAVCRTRIRKHDGSDINVYFSSDWNDLIQTDVMNYIASNDVRVKDTTLDWIKPKWRSAIKSLMKLDPDFCEVILLKLKGAKFVIDLDEIYKLIPMSEKKVSKYNPMIRYLKNELDINLVVESSGGRFTSINNPRRVIKN